MKTMNRLLDLLAMLVIAPIKGLKWAITWVCVIAIAIVVFPFALYIWADARYYKKRTGLTVSRGYTERETFGECFDEIITFW